MVLSMMPIDDDLVMEIEAVWVLTSVDLPVFFSSGFEDKLEGALISAGCKFTRLIAFKNTLGKVAIVDFLFPECNLIVELDGSEHSASKTIKARDLERDKMFNRSGFWVLRLDNSMVKERIEEAVKIVMAEIEHCLLMGGVFQ